MLGSLIALPAAALFWPSFPAAVDCVMASVGQPRPDAETAGAPLGRFDPEQLPEAPRFESSKAQGPFAFAQSVAGSPAQPLATHEHPNLIPLPIAQNRPEVATGARNAPASYVRPSKPVAQSTYPLPNYRQAAATARASSPPGALAQRTVPAGMQPTSMRHDPSATAAGITAGAHVDVRSTAPATLQELHHELRRRGVTYSLLETLAGTVDEYRFHCKVAVAGNARYTRHFEATSADPLAAMQLVLGQIESWQSGRKP